MVRLTVELDDDVAARLSKRASDEGVTVEAFLAKEARRAGQDPFEFFGAGSADVSALDTDELLAKGFGRI